MEMIPILCCLPKLTDNRQQTTDNRQQTTDNREQTTDNREQTTDTPLLSPIKQHGTKGFHYHIGIQKETSVFDIIQVVLQFQQAILNGRAISYLYLRPTGKSGPDDVSGFIKRDHLRQFLYKIRTFRSGTYQAHVAF